MASVKLIAKRLLLMSAGYLVAVLAGLLAIVAIYAVLSSLPNAPAYFSLAGLTPVAVLVVPPLGISFISSRSSSPRRRPSSLL